MPPALTDTSIASLNRIELHAPDGSTRIIPVRDSRLLIGRAPNCHIHLDTDLISRHHAEIIHGPLGGWWVRDLGSRNGVKVNGKKTAEQFVSPGDVIRVGKFDLHLLGKPESIPAAAPPTQSHDHDDIQVQTLDEGTANTINAAHLSALLDFGRRLTELPDLDARRLLLCQLMTSKDFCGQSAFVLRGAADNDIRTLAGPAFDAAGPKPYHISRTLLRAMRKLNKPVIGSNAQSAEDVVQLSLDRKIMPLAGIVCPLDAEEILYVALPPAYAKPEWLNLAALAATQFRNAEAAWQERRRAQQLAAVEKELKQAQAIQQHYLPTPKDLPGCRWSLRIEPCLWVGGDYADIVRLPDGRIFAAVADVCGKGLQAAMVGASVHTLIRTVLLENIPLPAMMERANAYLCQFLPRGSFVTFTAILADPANRTAEYFNAGNPSPFLILPSGKIESLPEAPHMPLGIASETYSSLTLPLPASFLFFSDGCTDIINPAGDRLGEEDLAILLQQTLANRSLPPRETVEGLFAKLESHRGASLPPDDRTLLACMFE